MKDKKIKYCSNCKKKTEHIETGFRKPLNSQRYKCKVCGEEYGK